MNDMKSINETIYRISNNITGPVMFHFVWWILNEANKRGIKRLYFLARDGYVLRDIAIRFCEQFGLDIECRYLYCSRKSLRMPSYHFIGDEAYDLLLLGGYNVTLRSLMERAEFSEEERMEIYKETGLDIERENEPLSKIQLHFITNKLRESTLYRKLINQKSRASYEAAIGYLKQEGLFDIDRIAIVDSGWTGSMQRSLRQLLESTGRQVNIIGFYFGMYVDPKEEKDGEYLCWYFNRNSSKYDKIFFSNNVFECMLSAPHGMTTGYEADEKGGWRPVLNEGPSASIHDLINTQINGILDYTDKYLTEINFKDFNQEVLKKRTKKLLKRIMVSPTYQEAEAIGAFAFCDDITEFYKLPLAHENQVKALKRYAIIPRIVRKLIGRSSEFNAQELFWPYGTAAFLPSRFQRWWYKQNIFVWEWLRYTLK